MEKRNGKVRWFDALSGNGVIRDSISKESFSFHFTAIDGISKNNYQWPSDEDKRKLSDIEGKNVTYSINSDNQIDSVLIDF